MSARDAQRALLDALLGEERDKPPELQTGPVPFWHDSVDKHLLVGCSPRELLKGTRFAPAAPAVPQNPPTEAQLREYNQLTQAEKDEYGYELDLLNLLRRLVRECDQRVQALEQRLGREEADRTMESVTRDAQAFLYSDESYQALATKVKAMGSQGMMADALKAVHELRMLEDQRNSLLRQSVVPPKNVVCRVTGNLMALMDTDERILAHYEGRAFTGWTIIRKKLEELERINPHPPRGRHHPGGRPRPRSRDRRR